MAIMDGINMKLGEMNQPGFHNSLTTAEEPGGGEGSLVR